MHRPGFKLWAALALLSILFLISLPILWATGEHDSAWHHVPVLDRKCALVSKPGDFFLLSQPEQAPVTSRSEFQGPQGDMVQHVTVFAKISRLDIPFALLGPLLLICPGIFLIRLRKPKAEKRE